MANTFTQQAEDAGILQEGRFGGGINRDKVIEFLTQVDRVYVEEMGKREKELAERAKEIAERDDENAKANSVIEDLKSQSQEQDKQIADLQEKVSAYEEGQVVAEGITTSLNEASATIQNLRDENKALKEHLNHIESTDPAAETVAQRKTITALRNALTEAEESSDAALKAKITELEQLVQAQKDAAEGGSPWSSLGDAASAVETLAKARADARDQKSRTRAKAIVSQAQFTALEVIGKASKQYDAMMTAGENQVNVTNDTLHEGYTEYTKYIAGLNDVVEDSIQNLEDTLDTAVKKLAEVVSIVKSLREAQKPLTKAAEDVFKPVALTGIKTADKLPGMSDVLAFIAAAPGVGISEENFTEKDVKDAISKVDAKYSEMQINIANTMLKDGETPEEQAKEIEEPKEEEVAEVEEPTEETSEEPAEEPAEETAEEPATNSEGEPQEPTGETEAEEPMSEDAPKASEEEESSDESDKEDTPDESQGIPQTEVEETEEVDPAIPDDATTVIPVIKK